MKKVKMMSFDTASQASGWAYWENAQLTEHGVIDLKKMKDKEERLTLMCERLLQILNEKKPTIVIIEMTVVENNAGTQRLLSEIVGVVRGWAMLNQLKGTPTEFVRLRPTEWRKLVRDEDEKVPKSKKDGLKEWDIQKANHLFRLQLEDDNEADAILVGFARIKQFRNMEEDE